MAGTDKTRLDLMVRALTALRRVGRGARSYDGEWLAMNVGMAEFKAMLLLASDHPLTVGGIARVLSISEPGASVLVDRLVGRGLATRESDPSDRRRTLVEPSPEGQAWIDRLRLIQETQVKGCLDLLERSDLEALVQGAEALALVVEQQKERT